MRAVAAIAVVGLLGAGAWYYSRSSGGGGGASAPEHRRLELGEAQSGALTDSDPRLRTRGPYQLWTLRGRRGQRVVIDMSSGAFDSYLMLRTPEGYLIGVDDDGGGGNNARLRTVLPGNGSYTLVAGAFSSGGRGDYTLTASEWIVPEAPTAGSAQTVAMGETKDGMLEPGDELTGDGPYQDRWTFDLAANTRARVTMSSSDLDSYLIVLDPEGATVVTNDDASGRDAAAIVRAASAGRYTALATTYGDQPRVGAYRLGLSEITGEIGTISAVELGETKEGRLEPGDSTSSSGGMIDVYTFTAPVSRNIQIDLVSTDFDPVVTLMDANGMQLGRDDDGGGSFNSRLVMPVVQGRSYRIVAGTYGAGRSGAYRLAVNPAP